MSPIRLINESQLDNWVRSNPLEAQGTIVELIWRLVAAASPRPKERRFPLGDSIGQPGPDGILDTDFSFNHFVPEGRSYWEIGTGTNAGVKATSDYRDLTKAIPESIRHISTFIFVTPLSGRKDWQYTWKEDSQASWLESRRNRNEWRNIQVIDGTVLIDWLYYFPAVELWFAEKMGIPIHQMHSAEQYWAELRTIGEPPSLPPFVFLANREAACEKLNQTFSGNIHQLKIDTYFNDQVAGFIAAYIATMDEDARVDVISRCLVISDIEAWNSITSLRESHILIANFHLDETDNLGTRLLEKARRGKHTVIFAGLPGGIPHPNRISISNPNSYQIQEALVKAGYKEERARILAQKSNGNLGLLLRCIQNLSIAPEWAQNTNAADLAIVGLLGSWCENSINDIAAVENLSGNLYGDWIGKIREISFRPNSPLIQRDGNWKFVPRYEGWYALGIRLFDEHLKRFKDVTVSILRERDPQFELPPDERYASSIHGKALIHSRLLRNGLAESLALLGSHSKALTSCTVGKAQETAHLVVREILSDADWVLWASLTDLLPLLAEAAPEEFLKAVEKSLNSKPCPFDSVFNQERSGTFGRNYISGLLWALETLAWDANYLTRVVLILGDLDIRDPGGNWGNRPANSLITILLPWMPQTCASVPKRQLAVETFFQELPKAAWKLLLKLLPTSHQVSSGSHKPAWREIIPEDWTNGVSHQEYWEQVNAYSELAIIAAKQDTSRIAELIERIDDLSEPALGQLLQYLRSETITLMSQFDRLPLWAKLVDVVSRHKRFSHAKWAMKSEKVNELVAIVNILSPDSPFYRHQRLFSERDLDLYEETDNYEEQSKLLEDKRKNAVTEVLETGGPEAVFEFASSVESPWRVGISLGMVAVKEVETTILPSLLESGIISFVQFAGGFTWGMFNAHGWEWLDGIDTSNWTTSQKAQFLSYLPFNNETWDRAKTLLGKDESLYWVNASVNPYQAESNLERAIDLLVEHGRPNAAIRCINKLLHEKQPFDSRQAFRTLQAILQSSESTNSMDAYATVNVIMALQNDPKTNLNDLFQIEWAFLPLLDRDRGTSPKLLEQRLAEEPSFYCEVIRMVFKSRKDSSEIEEHTEQQKSIAKNAYHLLSEWRTPPGIQKDGTFRGDKLTDWLENVKIECTESGHLEVALSMIGHVLIYSPSDPSGLWINHSVATVLNAKDSEKMREGFRIQLLNSRGVHTWTAGKEERVLAQTYHKKAEEIASCGYHRLADTLRKVADSYEYEAEREAREDPFDY